MEVGPYPLLEDVKSVRSMVIKSMPQLSNYTACPLHRYFTPGAFDLVGPINPQSRGLWILAATKCFIKWIKTVALTWASGAAIASFIRNNIIYTFGIPKCILSDNSTPLINSHVRKLCEKYGIHHVRSSPYYPRGMARLRLPTKICC